MICYAHFFLIHTHLDLQSVLQIIGQRLFEIPKVSTFPLHQLRMDGAPFVCTPNHRVMMGDGATVKAIDLKVGSMVQTSDGDIKEVLGVRLEKVSGTADVFVEVACFLD